MAVLQKQESLNSLPDLVTKRESLYTKKGCYCIQTKGLLYSELS